MTHTQVIKTNWKNEVRFNFEGITLSELKAFVKIIKQKHENDYKEWCIRNSPEFKDIVTNKLY